MTCVDLGDRSDDSRPLGAQKDKKSENRTSGKTTSGARVIILPENMKPDLKGKINECGGLDLTTGVEWKA